MKSIITLAAVVLFLSGCGKSGSSDDSAVSAQSISGSYLTTLSMTNGDVVVLGAIFSAGRYESRTYTFPGGDMSKGLYVKYAGADVVSGGSHTVTMDYMTCATYNGTTFPAVGTFPVKALANNQIALHSASSHADITMIGVNDIEAWLNSKGMMIAIEDTDCNGTF